MGSGPALKKVALVAGISGLFLDAFLSDFRPQSAPGGGAGGMPIEPGPFLGKNKAFSAPRCVWYGKIRVCR